MAYKFQLGKAKLSGSIEVAQKLTVDAGGLEVAGDVALDNGVIDNAELANSEITINGYATALGSSVTLDTGDVAEGSNLYWTEARFDASLATKDTDDLAEGSNLYYTDARARAAVSVTDVSGDGSLSYDSATGVITYTGPSASEVRAHLSAGDGLRFADGQFAVSSSIAGAGLAWNAGVLSVDTAEIASGLSGSVEAIVSAFVEGSDFVTFDDATGTIGVDASKFSGSFDAALATKDTDDLAEGSNLYWTVARGESMFDDRLATKDTGDLAEGANLYYTDARVRAAVSAVDAGGDGSFSYANGVFTYNGPTAGETRAHFTSSDFISYVSGTGAFGVLGANFTGSARSTVSAMANGGLAYNSGSGLFGIASYAAGNGLSISSGSFAVNVDASSIEIAADTLQVKALGITNGMLAGNIENAKLVNSSVTVVAGDALSGGGTVALGSSITLDVEVNGDALEITGDQIALKSQIAGAREFTGNVTIGGDLIVNGTTTYVNTTELVIEDALIQIASGSAFAAGQGLLLGTANSLQTVAAVADVGNALSSSLPLVAPAMKADSFYGNLVGSMQLGVEAKSANATIAKNVTKAMANITLTLPSSPVVGQEHRVKCFVADTSSPAVVVAAQVGGTIEGESQVVLQSYGAAVSLVWDGSMWMIF